MASRLLIASIIVLALFGFCSAGGYGGGHKKVIIHVPYKVKHIHHTHTVVKHVGGHEGGGGDHEYYKVIGYSGGIDDGEVVSSHAGGGHGWEGGLGGGSGKEIGHSAPLQTHENLGGHFDQSSHGGDLGGYGGDLGGHGGDLGGHGGDLGAYGGDLGGHGASYTDGGHDFSGSHEGGYGGGYGGLEHNAISQEGGQDSSSGGYYGGVSSYGSQGSEGGHSGYD